MKKSASKAFEDFPSVTLYLNDIREILNILTSYCDEVTLRAGEYDQVEPSELDQLAQNLESERFPDIYIQAHRPYISIELRSFGVRVYISEDEATQRGVVSKVRDVFKHRERRHFGKIVNILSAIPALGCGAFLIVGEYKYSAGMLLIFFLSIYPAVKYQMNNKVVLFTKSRDARPSFFKRRKDDLVIALVSASAGAVISFALVKFLGTA